MFLLVPARPRSNGERAVKRLLMLLLCPISVVKYCKWTNNSKTVRLNFNKFLCMLPRAVTWSSSDGVFTYFRFYVRHHIFITWDLYVDGQAWCCVPAHRLPLAKCKAAVCKAAHQLTSSMLPRRPGTCDVAQTTALQLTRGLSQRLRKQSVVMTIEAATSSGPLRCSHMTACVQKKFAIQTSRQPRPVFDPVQQNVAMGTGAKSAIYDCHELLL